MSTDSVMVSGRGVLRKSRSGSLIQSPAPGSSPFGSSWRSPFPVPYLAFVALDFPTRVSAISCSSFCSLRTIFTDAPTSR